MAGRIAGAASFLLVAETGQFNADITAAEVRWAQTTANMSEHTLKVNSAQTRLRETLAKYPNDVQRVNRATVSLMTAQREAATATHRTTSALDAEARGFGRLERGALVGSGALRGLGRSAAFASTAFIGGAGFVYALRSSIKAAEDHQVVQKQLGAAVRAAGLQFGGYRKQIEETLRSLRLLSGFTEEDTAKSFTTLVRGTKNVAEALKLEALAANVARGRNIELSQATMIVIKAHMGMAGQLRRLGIDVDKHATALQLIAKLTQVYGGSVAAFTKTAAGSQARFTQAIYETKVAVGTALLPMVTKYLNEGTKWLSQSQNQARVTRDVKEAVKVAGTAIHVLTGFIQGATAAAKPLVKALGGVENAMKLAFGVLVLRRVGLLRLGILGVGTAADTAAAGGVATLSAALSGLLSKLASLGADSPLFAILTGPPADASRRVGLSALVHDANRKMSTKDVIAEAKSLLGVDITAAQVAALRKLHSEQGKSISDATAAAASAIVGGQKYTGSKKGLFDRIPHDPTGKTGVRPAPPSATIPRRFTDALNAAALTSGTADDLRAAQAEEGYLRAQLARTKKGTQLYSDILAALVSAHSQTQGVLSQMAGVQRKGVSARAKAARERAQDIREKQRAYVQAQKDTATELKLEVENAKLGVEKAGKDQRLKALETYYLDRALKNEIAFDEAQSKNMRLRRSERERFALEAARLRREDARLGRGGKKGSFDAEKFFLEQQSSFFGSFGSNDFTQSTKGGRTRRSPGAKDAATVVVNQHFPAMTTDRHREARLAYSAYRAQFDG